MTFARFVLACAALALGSGATLQAQQPQMQQDVSSVVHPSPEAAALGKFHEVPVSLHTGLPTIEVPVWQLKQGDLVVDVALSYHGGGIKVDEIASWVGLGWSLNGGGMVTRAARSLPDDPVHFRAVDRVRIHNFRTGTMSHADQNRFKLQVARGLYDSEPDLFHVSAPGFSCRFFMGDDGTYVVMPKEVNARVEDELVAGYHRGWVITDGKGVKYRFTVQESNTTETYAGGQGQPNMQVGYNSTDVVSSWCLTEMEDVAGNKITYTYRTAVSNFANITSEYVDVPIALDATCGQPQGYTYVRSYVTSQQLAAITSGQQQIRFVPDASPRLDLSGTPTNCGLQRIEVWYGNDLRKKFQLNKSYFESTTGVGMSGLFLATAQDGYRLRLDSFQEQAADGSVAAPAYVFTYDNTSLPPRHSRAQDHWGYFNGANNTVGVAYRTQQGLQAGANKTPSPAHAIAGTLTSVRYPTGGSVEFEYEGNKITAQSAGGVIIRQEVPLTGVNLDNSPPTSNPNQMDFEISSPFTITQAMYGWNTQARVVFDVYINDGGSTVPPWNFYYSAYITDANGVTIPMSNGQIQSMPAGNYVMHAIIGGSVVRDDSNPRTQAFISASAKVIVENATGPSSTEGGGPGLRIKKITKRFGSATTEVRAFNYNDPATGFSSGQLGNFPSYEYTKTVNRDAGACSYTTFSSHSNFPLINTKSSCIGYSHVTEYFDAAGASGKKVYTYSNFVDNNDFNPQTTFPFLPNSPQDWKRGLELTQTTYSGSGPYEKQVEQTSGYNVLANSLTIGYGIKIATNVSFAGSLPVLEDAYASVLAAVPYQLRSDSYQVQEKVVTEYRLGTPVTTRTLFGYAPGYYQLRKAVTAHSDGSRAVARYNYPTDYQANAGASPVLAGLLAANRVNVPVEQSTLRLNGGTAVLVAGVAHEYGAFAGPNNTSRWYLKKIHAANTAGADTASRYNFLSLPAHYYEKAHVTHVTERGSPVSVAAPGGAVKSYVWGYGQTLPLAEVQNAAPDRVACTSFEPDSPGGWVFGGYDGQPNHRLQTSGAHAGRRCYRLDAGWGVGTTVPQAGDYVLSFWASSEPIVYSCLNGQCPSLPYRTRRVGPLVNGFRLYTYETALAAGTGLNIDAHNAGTPVLLDDVRLHPVGAQMTAFTYDPLVGVTSKSDAANLPTYYEYDALGRLKHVKDLNGHVVTQQEYNYQP